MLALIAGSGRLPAAVAAAQPVPPLVCVLRGNPPEGLEPDIIFRLETLGSLIAMLQARGVRRLCLCGAVRRPEIDLGLIDDQTLPLVPELRAALRQGDDGALRAALTIFERAGFEILGAHQAAPELLPPVGVPTLAQPGPEAREEARLGEAAVAEMGARDLGQACVIREGRVIAREDEAGTDALLQRLVAVPRQPEPPSDPFNWAADAVGDLLGGAADWLSGEENGRETPKPSGILFKAPKPQQDRRADLPAIGPATVEGAARAGLAGLVVEAQGVLVLDRPAVIAAADRAGLFLWIRERSG
ncbi:MAG: LpxI family protein [Paracoccaceae bacterium]